MSSVASEVHGRCVIHDKRNDLPMQNFRQSCGLLVCESVSTRLKLFWVSHFRVFRNLNNTPTARMGRPKILRNFLLAIDNISIVRLSVIISASCLDMLTDKSNPT